MLLAPAESWTLLPLEGIRVIDASQNVAGPYAGMILADLGAEVTKIEPPQGDATKTWGPPFWYGCSPSYLALNRNKAVKTLDLKDAASRSTMLEMLATSDILLVSSRLGVMKRLGLDFPQLHARFPRLIYAELTAFGHKGPRSSEPGYDPLMQALGGIMSVTGLPEYEPIRVGVSMIDMATGLWTALGAISALKLRDAKGEGVKINTSLYETALAWMAIPFTSYWASGRVPRGWGSGTSMIAPYEAFPTSDGYVIIGAGNDQLFQKLSKALNHPEWSTSPQFGTNAKRVQNRAGLKGLISSITKTKSSAEMEEILKAHNIPASRVMNVAQVNSEPQVKELGIVQSIEHPKIPDFRSMGLPVSFDGERPPLRKATPC